MLPVILVYLGKVSLCSGLLLGYYWVALRNKAFHYYNRFYLLTAVVLSILIPVLRLQWFIVGSDDENALRLFNLFHPVRDTVVSGGAGGMDWPSILIWLLGMISVCMIVVLFSRIYRIYRLKKAFVVEHTAAFDFIITDLREAPFSFFRNIFWRRDIAVEESTGQQILRHEIAHVRERHSWDKFFLQLVLCFFWGNPFFWIIRRELFLIHEFIADREAVCDNDAAAFAAMLLYAQYGQTIFTPAQSFFYSPIKRRFLMLTTSNKPRYHYLRRIISLPLLAIILVLFAFRVEKQNVLNAGQPAYHADTTVPAAAVSDSAPLNDSILYILDGKVVKASILSTLDPAKISSVNVLKNEAATKKYGERGKYGVVEITMKKDATHAAIDDTGEELQAAAFPGGADAWKTFLEKNLKTDVLVRKHAPVGLYTVVVSFHVDPSGHVSGVKALNDPGYGAAGEAERVIAASGKWQPAKQEGVPVSSETRQSISIKIVK